MSFWLPLIDPDQPPIRVMALHALAYCERLFYLEEVEEIRVADDHVFAGRQLHAALEEEEGEQTSIEIASEKLGLIGKVDCLRRRDGSFLPYEHKRGKAKRLEDNTPEAWPSDRMQIIAYALLIEDSFGQDVPEGRIRYHADNVTVRVPIDFGARQDLETALQRARELRLTTERPPITTKHWLCERCSLAPVCLPEEVRQLRDSEREVKRLFPIERDGASIHVLSAGASVGCDGDELVVRPRGEAESRFPLGAVEEVLLHGHAQITSQALARCVEHNVGVHWLSLTGYHKCSMVATAGQVQRRIRQYQGLLDESVCLRLVRLLVEAKIDSQYRYLMRATRKDGSMRDLLERSLGQIRDLSKSVETAADRDSLRGLEGMAAVHYFAGLRAVLNANVPDELRSDHRNRRPPLDRFNALLGFGYGLLHTAVMRAVLASGLEPAFGFFHTPRSAAYPLVLDLMELFRVSVWDIAMIASLNRGQWDPVEDFEVTKARVWLSEAGRKKAIVIFQDRLQETWKHPVLDYSLTYVRTIELEARLLEKEWSGEPGLFAKSRLR